MNGGLLNRLDRIGFTMPLDAELDSWRPSWYYVVIATWGMLTFSQKTLVTFLLIIGSHYGETILPDFLQCY